MGLGCQSKLNEITFKEWVIRVVLNLFYLFGLDEVLVSTFKTLFPSSLMFLTNKLDRFVLGKPSLMLVNKARSKPGSGLGASTRSRLMALQRTHYTNTDLT